MVHNDFLQAKVDASKSQSLSFTYNSTFTLDKKCSQDGVGREKRSRGRRAQKERNTENYFDVLSILTRGYTLQEEKKRLW